ncbi:hypothetical protein [Selenomonas ruminantium]|uniref:Nucleotidyltransferase n=1 Tax=Selenomonas ruminantium TaxID=971 RepID=A0A1H0NXY9_SELRU|nr:hypothetical protein [Selenomonas ruminantium]SDO97554.1 hypothetical protein SAMN05216366_10428 [Selenomonas ruminantium]
MDTANKLLTQLMVNKVNLDKDIVSQARKSRDNLLENIKSFSSEEDFFELCDDFNIQFGSFARKTKCQPLDDIDLMIGLSARGATYSGNSWDEIKISIRNPDFGQKMCMNDDGTLNSRKVLNQFKRKLQHVREYARSELNKRQEAVVLNLISKDWSYDLVPCFHTTKEYDGREYFLIPNGNGNWKKTAPDRDRAYVTRVNQEKDGMLLELVRLCKYWKSRKLKNILPSYLLETILVVHSKEVQYLKGNLLERFADALCAITDKICYSVPDMKNIQDDINDLDVSDRHAIYNKACDDYNKVLDVINYERIGSYTRAINILTDVLGDELLDE